MIALVEHPQRMLSRDQLLDLARGRSAAAFDRSIDTQVSRLRKKIEADPADPKIIKTSGAAAICTHNGAPDMTRFLPRTLFGQMVLILLAGLLVSHLVGTLIFASDRARQPCRDVDRHVIGDEQRVLLAVFQNRHCRNCRIAEERFRTVSPCAAPVGTRASAVCTRLLTLTVSMSGLVPRSN